VIAEIIEYALHHGVHLAARNGTKFNTVKPKVLEANVQYGFRDLNVAIDGATQEVYEQYRVRGDLNKVLDNIRTINTLKKKYRTPFPRMNWQFIVFGHNEHQIEEARSLSKKLGFKEFVVKKTGRFFSNVKLKGKDEHKGLVKPKLEQNINKSLKKESKIVEKYGSVDVYLDQAEIDCKVLKNKEIYISAEGIVLPCCWLAGQMYKWYLPPNSTQIWDLIDKDKMNINKTSLYAIFKTNIFDKIRDTWAEPSVELGKIKTCALKCGQELDQFGDQFK